MLPLLYIREDAVTLALFLKLLERRLERFGISYFYSGQRYLTPLFLEICKYILQ